MPRTSDAKQRMITAMARLMYQRSYQDVGVADVCREAGVTKGSFYHFFPSKQDLAIAAMDYMAGDVVGPRLMAILATKQSPLQRLANALHFTFLNMADMKRLTGAVCGGTIGNVAVEMGTLDERLRNHAADQLDQYVAAFQVVIDEAVASGEIQPLNSDAAARLIVKLLEGSMLFAKAKNDPDEASNDVKLFAENLFNLQLPEPNIDETLAVASSLA